MMTIVMDMIDIAFLSVSTSKPSRPVRTVSSSTFAVDRDRATSVEVPTAILHNTRRQYLGRKVVGTSKSVSRLLDEVTYFTVIKSSVIECRVVVLLMNNSWILAH